MVTFTSYSITCIQFCQIVAAVLPLSNTNYTEAAILLTGVLSKPCLNEFSVYVHVCFASSIIQVNSDNVQTVQSQQRWFRIWKTGKCKNCYQFQTFCSPNFHSTSCQLNSAAMQMIDQNSRIHITTLLSAVLFKWKRMI